MAVPLIFMCLIYVVSANNDKTIQFITSFIENEEKPTFLMYDLCWDKNADVSLAIQLSNLGVRASKSMDTSKYLDHEQLFLLNVDCSGAFDTLLNASMKNLLRAPYRWLVLTSKDQENSFEELDLLADSEFVVAQAVDTGFLVNELHRPSTKGPIHKTPRGTFNGTYHDVRKHRSIFMRRKDIMGQTLTMSNVIQDSNSTQYHLPREDRLELGHDVTAKISWSNVRLAFEMLNATPRYIFSHRYGFKLNGVWSGMIDDLYSKRADVGTNILVRPDRLPVVVYTDNLVPFRVRFIFRQPPLSYMTNIFALPFSTGVWVATAVCCALTTAGLYLASRWEVSIGQNRSRFDGGLGDAMLITMSAVSQQGCDMEPKKAAGRIIGIVMFVALMALYFAYSANILVLLQAPSNSIRNLGQFGRSKITMAAYNVDYNHIVLKAYANDPVRQGIYKRIESGSHYYGMKEGVERLRQGLFSFHAIVEPVYRQIEKTFKEIEKCNLMEVDYMNDFDPFIPVRRDSPYLELLRVAFKRIRESGIRSCLNRRMQIPKPQCGDHVTAFSSVGIVDLSPVLILMMYGVAVSILTLVAEIIVFKMRRSQHE